MRSGEAPTAAVRAAILALTGARGPERSVCPSEVARAVDGEQWRSLMDDVRAVARALARDGAIEVTQRGRVLDPDAAWRGPVRLRAVRPERP